jgi:N-acetylglucosaminyl-diphospho-decaprenol L-rhamnosyltransferase
MSISRQTLSAVIVTFKSDQVIHDCIQSISDQIKIIVVDNSNDKKFKENIEKKYNNVECILSTENLGMGSGNNLGLKHVKTDYAILLNPDVILDTNTIDQIIDGSLNVNSFGVLAPLSVNKKYPNYKIDKKYLRNVNNDIPFKVKSVDGYAMVLNLKRINQYQNFKDNNYFDENFFMYLENDDFCKRLNENGESIYVVPNSKVNHLGGKATNKQYEYEVELSRNWHWIWSKFYYNKKHFSYFFAFFDGLPTFLSAFLKVLFYFFINQKQKKIYLQRCLGFTNAMLGKKSGYRPKINNQ